MKRSVRVSDDVVVSSDDFMDRTGSVATCNRCGWEGEVTFSPVDAIKAGHEHVCADESTPGVQRG